MLNRRKVCLHGKWSEINSPMSCFSSSIVTLCVFSFCLQAQLILAFQTLLFIAMPVWHNVSGLMGLGLSLLTAVASDSIAVQSVPFLFLHLAPEKSSGVPCWCSSLRGYFYRLFVDQAILCNAVVFIPVCGSFKCPARFRMSYVQSAGAFELKLE